MCADRILKVKYALIVLLAESGSRSSKCGNSLFVEQNVKGKPALKTVAMMIHVSTRL
ncbi:hypothetical protein MKK69_29125 [Methylobacterium sp. J-026]|uniref:hypothetical protein n=1 Tax=Methylobacterium sp. J-026 TaxID=2836624 RepID=UPI001FBA8B84|nr:hypothetical protein [Methylobacterium sp. J-026]MCJ2138064.1 hypothetical protein [Methylobacterium sp. J-026]